MATKVIQSIVGTGTQGFSGDNGPAIAANINRPFAIVVTESDGFYFCDGYNHRQGSNQYYNLINYLIHAYIL